MPSELRTVLFVLVCDPESAAPEAEHMARELVQRFEYLRQWGVRVQTLRADDLLAITRAALRPEPTWVAVLAGAGGSPFIGLLADSVCLGTGAIGAPGARLWCLSEDGGGGQSQPAADLRSRLERAGEPVIWYHSRQSGQARLRELGERLYEFARDGIQQWARGTRADRTRGGLRPVDAEGVVTHEGGAAPGQGMRLAAFHPTQVAPEQTGRLLVYIHQLSAIDAVAEDVVAELRSADVRGTGQPASRSLEPGAEITVVPQAGGLTFSPDRHVLQLWGDRQRADFFFRAAGDLAGTSCNGSVLFLMGGIAIGSVSLSVYVSSAEREAEYRQALLPHVVSPYRDVFVSYSHRDTPVVEMCEHYVAVLGDRYLRDINILRCGERWHDALLSYIDRADLFQLFWSERAAHSPHVTDEWQRALPRHRQLPGFIRPVFWEEPMYPPPAELADIHFTRINIEEIARAGTSGLP